jgi:type II secretory pathway component GspD/PulD (secretin)
MRLRFIILLVLVGLATASFAADQPETVLLPCADPAASCNISMRDQKKAGEAFARGQKLQKIRQLDQAFSEFEAAANLNPRAVDYLTARELTRQQLVYEHLERGNTALLNSRQVEALAEFRGALQLDPHNDFAQQRLRDALGEWAPKTPAPPQVLADAGEVRVAPQEGRHDFHYRGDSRGLLTQVASAFGVVAAIDDSVAQRPVRFNVENVDFYAAMRIACQLTRSFWTPVGEKQVLLALDTPENHRQFDRMVLRTFYIPSTVPQEVTEMGNVIRTVFDIRFLTPELQASALTIRAPQPTLDAITTFIESVSTSRPEVMLDVHVYQISHTLVRNLGLHLPNQFQMFNIPAAALTLLGGQSIQDLINQLISGGGINQAGSQSLAALLAQLQNQQNSIFSQPLATFGGGLTLFGLSLGTASAQLSLNESSARTLEHATLRASQGKEASFRVGVRYPILNASFAPIFNTPQIAKVIQNNSFQAAFPSFSYEDIGVTLKAKPSVTGNRDVGLDLDLEIRSLTGQTFNGVPVISSRGYKGSIVVKDGEPAVVAGSVSRSEQRSLSGIPGMGAVPGLNKVMTTNSKEEDEDELLVVITPHVISHPGLDEGTEIWVKAK